MSVSMRGMPVFHSNVSGIDEHGLWVLCEDKEYFVPFDNYPLFKKCSVDTIFNVQFTPPKHLRWDEIDTVIELDALEPPAAIMRVD